MVSTIVGHYRPTGSSGLGLCGAEDQGVVEIFYTMVLLVVARLLGKCLQTLYWNRATFRRFLLEEAQTSVKKLTQEPEVF